MTEQPYLIPCADWIEVQDGNDTARSIFNRHYSRRNGSKSLLFVGPGEKNGITHVGC